MQYLLMLIGTILAVVFILQVMKGRKYTNYVEGLNDNDFPLKDLYIVGFAWTESGMFAFKGKKASELKQQAALLYDPVYAEYYANVYWAQALTFAHLFLAATFLLGGFLYDAAMIMVIGGLFMTVVMVMYSMQNMKNQVSARTETCEAELPEIVSTMAILVNSGMMLREAWTMISESSDGAIHKLMKQATDNMRNGYSDADAIFLFGRASNSVEIKKFTSALLQSLEKGGGELGIFLARQSSEMWNTKRQKMLQSGEKASTKLLLPIVLIFVGIIIIVMTAAFAGALF